MAYDHARKAGNRGDVWKHFLLLTAFSRALLSKPDLLYRESHAGAPKHVLGKLGEWRRGIARVLPPAADLEATPYFRQFPSPIGPGDSYPSSWSQVAEYALGQGGSITLELCDTSEEVARAVGKQGASIRFSRSDGFESVLNSPPADFTLIDPPYHPDSKRDWASVRSCISSLLAQQTRFLAWYPIFSHTNPSVLVQHAKLPGFEVLWHQIGPKPSQLMKGCGVVADDLTASEFTMQRQALQSLGEKLGGAFHVRSPTREVG
ncbi:MAG: 23S rRNA (adenine(2030)-N(6))-methyltransferase RlmJ [Thermoanaerobaculia bacterium]